MWVDDKMIDVNWDVLGARLARLSTDEQIPFFKCFANEMLKYPSHYEMEMQLTNIREGIGIQRAFNGKQKEVYATLGWANAQDNQNKP